jgi:release factor glutamine methyltransferase
MPPDTVAGLLKAAQRDLEAAEIETAALDARLLLQAAAGLEHGDIIADPNRPLGTAERTRFADMISRRLAHEPVSRILGEREFFGRRFKVTPATLDPRPDTENLVEEALALLAPDKPLRVLDLGTGTGAIIISILAERPLAVGLGTDVSAAALAVAQSNAERHAVLSRLKFVRGNWFEGISGHFDLIVSNPPYIPGADIAGLAPEVRVHDPRPALCGGADGLDAYRQIAAGARCHLAADGRVAVEIGAGQEKDVEALFSKAGMKISGQRRDLAGRLRVLTFRSR